MGGLEDFLERYSDNANKNMFIVRHLPYCAEDAREWVSEIKRPATRDESEQTIRRREVSRKAGGPQIAGGALKGGGGNNCQRERV